MAITMLTIRDPDYENEYVTDGEVREITIDLGGQWNGYKDFCQQLKAGDPEVLAYISGLLDEVSDLAIDNPVRARVIQFLKEAANAS